MGSEMCIRDRDGLKTDPEKVRAIVEMPRPTDKAGVRRLLGMANYVTKFYPKPVRPHHTVENVTTSGCSVALGETAGSQFQSYPRIAYPCSSVRIL